MSGLFTVAGFVTHAAIAGSIQDAIGSEGMGLIRNIPLVALQALYGLGILTGAWFVLTTSMAFAPSPSARHESAHDVCRLWGRWAWRLVRGFHGRILVFRFSCFWRNGAWATLAVPWRALLDLTPPMARLLRT